MIANLVKKLITIIKIKSNRLNCGGGKLYWTWCQDC